jgi:hypothetical protein
MDNPEKLSHRARKTKKKSPKYDWHHFMETYTNNTNNAWIFLQTTGGKDEPNIVMDITTKGNNKITELRTILQRKVKTHKYINRQNQSTTRKLWKP